MNPTKGSKSYTIAKLTKLDKTMDKMTLLATRRAIDRTLVGTRTFAVRMIREELNIKAKVVNALTSIKKPTLFNGGYEGSITFLDRPFPMAEFQPLARRVMSARGRRIGVTVKITKERKLVKGAFIATMSNGHTGVFWRALGTQMPSKKFKKEKITERFTTKPTDYLKEGTATFKKVQDHADAQFKVEFDRDLAFRMNKEFGA